MSLEYRFLAEAGNGSVLSLAERSFIVWLEQKKNLPNVSLQSGAQDLGSGVSINVARASDEGLSVLRISLYEEIDGGRWSTTLTGLEGEAESWAWVDLEWVSDDPWGQPPVVGPPSLVQNLLTGGSMHLGNTDLPPAYYEVDSTQANRLSKMLLDAERRIPVVVMSWDAKAPAALRADRASAMFKALAGTAPVYVLDAESTAKLNSSLPEGMHVYGGAVRSYLPDLDPSDSLMRRHRVLGLNWLERDYRAASRIVAEPLRRRALSARPPELYRTYGRALLQSGDSDTEAFLLSELDSNERELEALRSESALLRERLEWQAALDDDTEHELDQAQARVRWLESELDSHDVHLAGATVPEVFNVTEVSSFEDLQIGALDLKRISMGQFDAGAAALDAFPEAPAWSRKAWRALVALDAYAAQRVAGDWEGDFYSWCKSTPAGQPIVSEKWIALSEDDRVNREAKFYGPRTFDVPTGVDASGRIYMPAHIKIVEGGRPAPRIHFFDDTIGATGMIHVGYIGPHLPNGQKY